MTREEILIKAASHLRESAEELRRSHTLSCGTWGNDADDQRARIDHDEMVELAAALLTMAQPA